MQKTIIIAEAGVNHNGSMILAKKLIDAAVVAGVDYVKFQTFRADNLVTKNAKKADYQHANTKKEEGQYEMLKSLELSPGQHLELVSYCRERGVHFFSTAFDLESIDFLSTLRLGLWKIPSGEITNFPYLKRVAEEKQPIILSTGMSTMEDIHNAIRVLTSYGVDKSQLTVLHCNTQYPTPMKDVNLLAMNAIGEELDVKIGYSDHTPGIEIPIAAVALGAQVIEKHFTLDRTMEGPDHRASLEPHELKSMVMAIRNVEEALGSPGKVVSSSEAQNLTVARKSIVAACPIKKGDLFTSENLTVKRPGNGISPMRWEEIVNKRAIRDFEPDDLIEI